MAQECPQGGKHNWTSNGPHQMRCSKCGEIQIVH